MLVELIPLKVFVKSDYVTNGNVKDEFIEAYLLAVKAVANRALDFTVYTEHGAIYSGLPIEAIFKHKPEKGYKHLTTDLLQPYTCLEGPVNVIKYSLLDNATCLVPSLKTVGNYLFTIDYHGNGLANDPEQHKTHNIIYLDSGQFAAMPNNYIQFMDNWFAGKTVQKYPYKRRTKTYYAGG